MHRSRSCRAAYRELRAFTLIELLVVLVILALLAGLIFPVFARVRAKGRQTNCLSNQRQLGMALLQYAQDNDERFPSGTQWSRRATLPDSIGEPGVGWAGQVFPYVKNEAVFRCPDDSPFVGRRNVVHQGGVMVSFGYNSMIPDTFVGADGTLVRVKLPAQTVVLFEISGNVAAVSLPDEGASRGNNMFSAAGPGGNLVSGLVPGRGD